MSLLTRRAFAVLLLMCLSAVLAQVLTPTQVLSKSRTLPVQLETALPLRFGDWHVDALTPSAIVNPQQADLISRLYNQVLTRTYTDGQGHSVMLSVVYAENLRDGLSMHYPEVCYPAQGFTVMANQLGTLVTPGGPIAVRRLETVEANERYEAVTYWTTVGDHVATGGAAKRLVELRYGLNGQIPDGLLFRVSSLGRDSAAQFALQQRFVVDLLAQLPASVRAYLAGSA